MRYFAKHVTPLLLRSLVSAHIRSVKALGVFNFDQLRIEKKVGINKYMTLTIKYI